LLFEDMHMTYREFSEKLRARANRCRELAASSTDEEAATALRQMADEMEAAIVGLGSSKEASRAESA
jgi:hypothetical protein